MDNLKKKKKFFCQNEQFLIWIMIHGIKMSVYC